MHQLTSIFCEVDDFCNELDSKLKDYMLEDSNFTNKRGPSCCPSDSEIMTILIMFQNIRYRDFKTYYCNHVMFGWHHFFSMLPSYHQFVELVKKSVLSYGAVGCKQELGKEPASIILIPLH